MVQVIYFVKGNFEKRRKIINFKNTFILYNKIYYYTLNSYKTPTTSLMLLTLIGMREGTFHPLVLVLFSQLNFFQKFQNIFGGEN